MLHYIIIYIAMFDLHFRDVMLHVTLFYAAVPELQELEFLTEDEVEL